MVKGEIMLEAVRFFLSYKVLLPIGCLIIVVYSIRKIDNFIKLNDVIKEHIRIFKGAKSQILFFFGTPMLFATAFVQLKYMDEMAINNLYVVITIVITMLFSILTVISTNGDDCSQQKRQVLKETRASITFELVISMMLAIYAFIYGVLQSVLGDKIRLILAWLLYYIVFVVMLNMFIVIKRFVKLGETTTEDTGK